MLEIIRQIGVFQHAHFRTEIAFQEKTWIMDVVSFVDQESEKMFHDALRKNFPEDAIMGEETYEKTIDYRKFDRLWIIDPLDGTLMYKRWIPVYWPMIAYIENWEIQYSAILLPEMNELYHADKTGAYRNNERIHVSQTSDITSCIIQGETRMLRRCMQTDEKYFHFLDAIGRHINKYSSALSLSLCAAGSIDGDMFYPRTGNIWDTVPGWFLIQQAGGKVTNFWSDTWDIFNPQVIFSNGHIHEEFQKMLES